MIDIVLLGLILGGVYLVLRARTARGLAHKPAHKPAQPPAQHPPPRRPTFSRAPKRAAKPGPPQTAKAAPKPGPSGIIDLQLRGAIFAITRAEDISGYDLRPLGPVVAANKAGMARAAAQQYPDANAITHLREVLTTPPQKSQKIQELHGQAVIATPRDPAMAAPIYRDDLMLIDGSNVMNWQVDAGLSNAPSLDPIKMVLTQLRARGIGAGVVFDANVGYHLMGRFVTHDELIRLLPEAVDILVVDAGTIADSILIQMARDEGLIIVSNDHFRDAPLARHLLKQKGYAKGAGITLLAPRP